MKSSESFWNQIAIYHENTIYIELLMIIIGIILTILLFSNPINRHQILMKIYLSFTFLWMGIVFFYGFDKSPIGLYFAGPLFLVISALFLADIYYRKIIFALPKNKWILAATFVWLGMVLIGYPVISYLLNHRYPALTTPFMPCPMTVFALTLLTTAIPNIDMKVYSLLLIWAALGLPKVFGLYDVREDTILFIAGVYSVVLIIMNWKDIPKTHIFAKVNMQNQ
jgi:hypothetical protein